MKSVVFFDDGGVLNNNKTRGEQWKPLVADYMVSKFGGDHAVWMDANYEATYKIISSMNEMIQSGQYLSYNDFHNMENTIWIETMFSKAGIQFPPKSDYFSINHSADAYVIPKIQSSYPNIVETVKILYEKGYTINTASGSSVRFLKLFLEPMGLLPFFKTLYGSDLIDTMKVSSHYYERIFENEQIDPSQAIIIDDNVKMLKYAEKLGAKVIQSCIDGQTPEFPYFYRNALEIPSLIDIINQ